MITNSYSSYVSWKTNYFGSSISGSETVDADGDGIANLLEYGFYLNPVVSSSTGLPTSLLIKTNSNDYLSITFTRLKGNHTGLYYIPEVSNDLVSWSTNGLVQVSVIDNGDTESATFRDNVPITSAAKRFIHLRLWLWDSEDDSMDDDWERLYFGDLSQDGTGNVDGDSFSNLTEYQQKSNPTDYYNGILPRLNIVSGNNQWGSPTNFLSQALVTLITDTNGVALTNAPVALAASEGNGKLALANTNGASLSSTLNLRSDSQGKVSIYFFLPESYASTNRITVTAQSGAGQIQETFTEKTLLSKVGLPAFLPRGNSFKISQWIKIESETQDSKIYYTLDGSEPTENSSWIVSGGKIWVDHSAILKAKAFKENCETSELVEEDYKITGAVSAGYGHSLLLKANGAVWAWGLNEDRQLGDGTTNSHVTATQVVGLTNITEIETGYAFNLALQNNGVVWSWGNNSSGQLGVGNKTAQLLPVAVNSLANVQAIAAGGSHAIALLSNGNVVTWGDNGYGQVGDGTKTDRTSPILIPNLSNIVSVAAGHWHSAALQSNGIVWVWGRNHFGQLGTGSTNDSLAPISVTSLSNLTSISLGGMHSVSVDSNNKIWAWGSNKYGELGNGTTNQSEIPTLVTNFTHPKQISSGYHHVLASLRFGTVWGWGYNADGQLGDCTSSNRTMRVKVNSVSQAVQVAAGYYHSLALNEDGTVTGWGRNTQGQLGISDTGDQSLPIQVPQIQAIPIYEDTDQDGLNDLKESQLGTNPNLADTDGDGMDDGWENKYGLNPLQNDAAGDLDQESLTNLEEYQSGTNPNLPDTDGEGLTDKQEISTYHTNPTASDSDGDGLSDYNEITIHHTDPLDPDSNDNGTLDGAEDEDGDGMSTSWELTYGLNPFVNDANNDLDQDGLNNLQEYQRGTNPTKTDTDRDTLTDGQEVNLYETSPIMMDTDQDSLPDNFEIQWGLDPLTPNNLQEDADQDGLTLIEEYSHGTNPNNSDTDGDGSSDGTEAGQGSNPNDGGDGGGGGGDTPPDEEKTLSITLKIGDDSRSKSEKYNMLLEDTQDGTKIVHSAIEYGKIAEKKYTFKKGRKYKVTLEHTGTNPEYTGTPNPDYDYTAEIVAENPGQQQFLIEDEQKILGTHREATEFYAKDKVAYLYVPLVELDLLKVNGYSLPCEETSSSIILTAQAEIEGIANILPKELTPDQIKLEARLVQDVNAYREATYVNPQPGHTKSVLTTNGQKIFDGTWDSQNAHKYIKLANQILITGRDQPNQGSTDKMLFNSLSVNDQFTVYLQYRLQEGEWKTLGKANWTFSGSCTGNPDPWSGTGTASNAQGTKSTATPVFSPHISEYDFKDQ